MRQLGMFAKFWAPGQVKTRLAASIGAVQAAHLHHAFVETLLERFRHAGDRRSVVFTPADRGREFAALAGDDWELAAQAEGDLGERMQAWFDGAFAAGAERAVLIGSDSPTLPASLIESAFELLGHQSVVLGPADDGGYYLVGAARQTPPIFERMAWSQPSLWSETVARLEALQWSYAALPCWYDVDDSDSLERLRAELERAGESDLASSRLRRELARICPARRLQPPWQ